MGTKEVHNSGEVIGIILSIQFSSHLSYKVLQYDTLEIKKKNISDKEAIFI
jgi:hypothetical protein